MSRVYQMYVEYTSRGDKFLLLLLLFGAVWSFATEDWLIGILIICLLGLVAVSSIQRGILADAMEVVNKQQSVIREQQEEIRKLNTRHKNLIAEIEAISEELRLKERS